jgi:hypothetical protein
MLVGLSACEPSRSDLAPSHSTSPDVTTALQLARASGGLASPRGQGFEALSGAFRGGADRVTVRAPAQAHKPVELRDAATGVAVAVALLDGSSGSAAELMGGELRHRNALLSMPGSVLVRRSLTDGFEDLVWLPSAPRSSLDARGAERLSFSLSLDSAAGAGLRLVGRTLEVLSPDGQVALRASPPWVMGSDGERVPASLELEGCAADRDPSPPAGRPLVPPGARECVLTVSWAGLGITYPALVDPVWQAASSLAVPRHGHAAALVVGDGGASAALVAGGFGLDGVPLTSTEWFQDCASPCIPSFAAGPELSEARGDLTATTLEATATEVRALVAGGTTATGVPSAAAEVLTCALDLTGCSSITLAMTTPRAFHTATRLASGRVLVAGGVGLASAELFDPSTGLFTPTATPMLTARHGHVAATLGDGKKAVLAGGAIDQFALVKAESFDETTGEFSQAPSLSGPRVFAGAAALDDGSVLVAGGLSSLTASQQVVASMDRYALTAGAVQKVVVSQTLSPGRAWPVVVPLLSPGKALVVGGADTLTNASAAVDEFPAPQGAALPLAAPLGGARRRHAAVRLVGGDVLVIGGVGPDPTDPALAASAERLLRVAGEPCAQGGECASGFCATASNQKVCCNEPCKGACQSCNQPGIAGTCTDLPAGAVVSEVCKDFGGASAKLSLACNAAGNVEVSAFEPCGFGVCDAAGLECAPGCTPGTADGCAPGAFCTQLGVCEELRDNGDECFDGDECKSALCADGVCCNTVCVGQCEGCALPGTEGTCTPLTSGQPVHGEPCDGEGDCAGECQGNPVACTYATGKPCGEPACVNGESTTYACDQSACVASAKQCFGYVCEAGQCLTSCEGDGECAPGNVCREGVCIPFVEPQCVGSTLKLPTGEVQSCNAYRCDESGTACKASCSSINDCSPGNVCNPEGTCGPFTTTRNQLPDCSAPGGLPVAPSRSIPLGVVLAAAWLRRRSSLRGASR